MPACALLRGFCDPSYFSRAFLEYGLPFTLGQNLTPAAVVKMFDRSPVKILDNMKTPTLFLLGKNDLRVPPAQSLYYERMLRARNVPTR